MQSVLCVIALGNDHKTWLWQGFEELNFSAGLGAGLCVTRCGVLSQMATVQGIKVDFGLQCKANTDAIVTLLLC